MEAVRHWSSVIDMAEETGAAVQDLDAQLMLRFKDGDTAAFDRLFVKHMHGIVNFAYRFVRNREIAEELAQEIFIKVYESAAGYRIQARFTSWLYRIATNVCLNEIRKPQFRVPHRSLHASPFDGENDEDRKLVFGTAEGPDQILERKDLSRIIRQALEQIPEKQRIAFILKKYQELSYSEIADVLESSEKAVKSLIHRAKEALAEKLKPFAAELLPR